MPKLTMLGPRLATADTRRVKPPPKQADQELLTPEHRAWRKIVLERARYRCEDIDTETGQRCTNASPAHRIYADHVEERRDGGALYDPQNGKARCAKHHTLKTNAARLARIADR